MLNELALTNSNCIPQTYSHRVSSPIVPATYRPWKNMSAIRSSDKNYKKIFNNNNNNNKHFKLPLKPSGLERLSRQSSPERCHVAARYHINFNPIIDLDKLYLVPSDGVAFLQTSNASPQRVEAWSTSQPHSHAC